MARQTINIGTIPNDGSGDSLRYGAQKINENFVEVYDNIDSFGETSGALAVGAIDGASGTLWTTVQGFIDKLLSSAGSSIVGFSLSSTYASGSVAKALSDQINASDGATSASTINFFGDSITAGYVSNVFDPDNAWRKTLMRWMGWTDANCYNGAISGGSIPDWIINAYLRTIGADSISFIQGGYNDVRFMGADMAYQDSYKAAFMGVVAYLAIPEANKIKGNSSLITYSGSWGTNPVRSYGKFSSTVGNTATFSVQGTTVYISTVQQSTDGGKLQVSVDGVDRGTWDLWRLVGNGGAVSSINYMPYLIRISDLAPGKHTVVITVVAKSAGSGSNSVYVDWVGSNGSRGVNGARVLVGSALRMNAAGAANDGPNYDNYTEAAHRIMNANHYDVVQQLASDGLEVELVPVGEIYNPDISAMVGSDNVHPSSSASTTGGHYLIAQAYQQALSRYRRSGSTLVGTLATYVASLAAKLTGGLNSYSPAIAGATTAGTNTYATRAGQWRRLGDSVFVDGRIVLSAKDAAMAGDLYITLPVACAGTGIPTGSVGRISGITIPAGSYGVYIEAAPNTTQAYLRFATTASELPVYPSSISGTMEIRFSINYQVAP